MELFNNLQILFCSSACTKITASSKAEFSPRGSLPLREALDLKVSEILLWNPQRIWSKWGMEQRDKEKEGRKQGKKGRKKELWGVFNAI